MPGFNTLPAVGGGGGQANMTFVGSVHMQTYNRSWAQGGTAGYYALYSTNQENGYAYFVGSGVSTGAPLNRLTNITHPFTRIDIIAPTNDMISLYKAKVKATTLFNNPFDADATIGKNAISSFPSVIRSSGNFVLPNNALPLVSVLLVGAGGGGYSHGGGGAGGGVIKLTAYQAVGTTSVTIGSGVGAGNSAVGGSTFFGNVYALGGQGAADHSHNNTQTAANGAGASGYAGQFRAGGVGVTQTTSTGLGATGTPVYHGGFSGGSAHGNGGGTHRHNGGGGGGSGGVGQNNPAGTNGGTTGGNGHASDITGNTLYYGFGGGGSDHHGNSSSGDGSYPSHGTNGYGHGAKSTYNSSTTGDNGAVIVRYYIA
jgi:hypothetical protein